GQGDGCAPRQQPAQPMAGAVEFEGTEGGPRRECRADPNAAENRVEPARAVLAETACPQPDPPCGVLGAPVVAEHSGPAGQVDGCAVQDQGSLDVEVGHR